MLCINPCRRRLPLRRRGVPCPPPLPPSFPTHKGMDGYYCAITHAFLRPHHAPTGARKGKERRDSSVDLHDAFIHTLVLDNAKLLKQRHQQKQRQLNTQKTPRAVAPPAPSTTYSPASSSNEEQQFHHFYHHQQQREKKRHRQQQQRPQRELKEQQKLKQYNSNAPQRTTTTTAPTERQTEAPPVGEAVQQQLERRRRQLARNGGRRSGKSGGTPRAMPKFLHALCCCLRPKAYKNKHYDGSSGADFGDGRGDGVGVSSSPSPITQVVVGGGGGKQFQKQQQQKQAAASRTAASNSTKILMGGEIRQRFTSSRQQQQQEQQQRRQQPQQQQSAGKGSSLTVVVGGEPQQQRQQPSSFLNSSSPFLLPRVNSSDANKNCLIVDLDETLVHSSFKPVKNADFIIPVEIDNVVHQVYVLKRPHTDHFLERIGALFECVLFTASLAKYADPVVDLLDKRRIFHSRLFRESCVFYEGNYVKDLSRLGRDLRRVIIIDNSPASYAFHPDNSIPVRTWFDDPNDRELLELLPLLEELARVDDIYKATGTVPPSQQPRCLTPSEDMLLPPPLAPSSPITQVLPPPQQQNSSTATNGISGQLNGGVKDANGNNLATSQRATQTTTTTTPPMGRRSATEGGTTTTTKRLPMFNRESSASMPRR
ncbi:hypothetical protein niasHT_028546 [Heterodera trifolii]|uniref:protein-serine/threonine phosphatase n=1 Tax=Heterodera trifolii TaxID=157864 RepID=A0ABD2KPX7_9BILA